jgi:hypothetical protein
MDNLLISILSPFVLLMLISVGFGLIAGVRPEAILRPFMKLAFSMLKQMLGIAVAAVKSVSIPLGEPPVSYSGQRRTKGAHHKGVDEEYGYNRRSGFKENTED